MSEPAWYEEARAIYAETRSYKEAAVRLGRPYSTVHTALNGTNSTAERRTYKRAWEREHDRARCACGNTMSAARRGYDTCRECWVRGEDQRRERLAAAVVGWWAEGLTLREIAERLGTTRGYANQIVTRLRRRGYDLPKRRPYYGNRYEKLVL